MKKLIIYYGEKPEYVEGFPKGCKRSCVGALHLYPRKQMEVTADEYAHMKNKKYSWLMKQVRMIAELKPKELKVDSKKKKSEAKAPGSDPGVEAESSGVEAKKKEKKKKRY